MTFSNQSALVLQLFCYIRIVKLKNSVELYSECVKHD